MNGPGRAATVTAAALLTILAPAAAAAEEPPQLYIEVDNSRSSAMAGDTLDYTVTVHNLDTTGVPDLTIRQSVPDGAELRTADRRGEARQAVVTWRADLAPSAAATFRTDMIVTRTPIDQRSLMTVACAYAAPDQPPLACASHVDQLPVARMAAALSSASQTHWYVVVVTGAFLGAAVVAHRRTR